VKTRAAIGVGSIAVLIAFVCFLASPLFIRPVGTTTPEAIRLVTEVEGVGKIIREAETLIAHYGTKASSSVQILDSELHNYSALSDLVQKLGSYSQVVIIPESAEVSGFPAQMRIRFGSHFHCHFLYVLDCRKPFDVTAITNREPRWSQVTSNIFVRT
jgi:hypothetical protein